MREIKFRFVYGIDGEIETYFTKYFTFAEIENGYHTDEICDSPLLKDYSILAKDQWTGLTGKEGKDIYEGDIIEVYDWGNKYAGLGRTIVEWCNDDCGWRYKDSLGADDFYDQFRNVIVIGNKYQDANLLE